MTDFLNELISLFKKLLPVITFFLGLILRNILERIVNCIINYLKENSIRFFYCLTNKDFIVSGNVKFFFKCNISPGSESLDKFVDDLKRNKSFSVVNDNKLSNRGISVRFKSHQNIILTITCVPAKEKAEMVSGDITDDDSYDEESKIKEESELKFKWEKISFRYRKFKEMLDIIREISDEIKEKFSSIVVKREAANRRVFIEIFYRNDCKFDESNVKKKKLGEKNKVVIITQYKNKIEFGGRSIYHILHYLPKYLTKKN